MIIKVKVRDAVVNISCGNGRQTFRWLGSVVQARIKQYGLLKNRFEDENHIVTEIRNRDNQLINPADLLVEHADGGNLEVIAIVASNFPVDEWEIPEMGDWLKGAHIKSKIGSQWMSEIEAWRDSLKTMKDASGRGEGQESNVLLHRAQPQTSNLIQIGFDFTESDIDSAFDLDWGVMKWDWLQPSELLKNQLGDVLKRNYARICNLFAHYCGIGQVGQRYGLTMQEFGHFLHYLKVCNFKTSEDIVEDIFYKTGNVSTGMASGNVSSKFNTAGRWPLMTRAHLAQAIICAALLEKEDNATDADALRNFFAHKLATFWEKMTEKYLFYSSADPVVKKSTFEYYPLLKQVFLAHAATDSKYGPRLTVSAFLRLLEEASLAEPEQETTVVGCFLIDAQLRPAPAWELEHLVFTEFMEALARVAVKLIEDHKETHFTDGKRIRMAFNFVSELNEGNRAHK